VHRRNAAAAIDPAASQRPVATIRRSVYAAAVSRIVLSVPSASS